MTKKIKLIFFLAFLVRFLYICLFAENPNESPDSPIYISIAKGIFETNQFVRIYDNNVLEVTDRTPLYPLFLTFLFFVFGENYFLIRIGQALIDSITCVVIGLASERIKKGSMVVAGVIAACNLNLIIHSSEILTDSLFLFFLTFHFYFFIKVLQRKSLCAPDILISFISLSLSILTRPMCVYFYFICSGLFISYFCLRNKAIKPLFCAIIPVLLFLPLVIKNKIKYDSFSLVSSQGYNLSDWYVPLIFQYSRGIQPEKTLKEIRAEANKTIKLQKNSNLLNPFQENKILTEISIKKLRELTYIEIFKGWSSGIILNLFIPNVSSLPLLIKMQRPRFFYSEGNNLYDKIWNFSKKISASLYFKIMIIGTFATLVLRICSLIGFIEILRDKSMKGNVKIYIFSFFLYFLIITGPLVSAARYRLPIEPILIISLAQVIHSFYTKRNFYQKQ